MIVLDSTMIRKIISKAPKSGERNYIKFWTSHANALEGFLGKGYKVIGFDPDFLVRVELDSNGKSPTTYTITIPIEVAIIAQHKALYDQQ